MMGTDAVRLPQEGCEPQPAGNRRDDVPLRLSAYAALISGIAHELNIALAPIAGLNDVLLKTNPDGSVLPMLEQIRQSGARARELAARIQCISEGRNLEFRPLRIADVLDETLRLAAAHIPQSCAVSRNIDGLPAIIGNRNLLSHAIATLLIHAAQAVGTSAATIAIDVSDGAEYSGAPGANASFPAVGISLVVSGSALDGAKLAQLLFSPPKSGPLAAGASMGLNAVHQIIAAHGGNASITGAGTVTHCTLCFCPVAGRFAGSMEQAFGSAA